ncbi:EpsG family protein [Epilithonimonas hungarica]|uniref:EpsG family protein n=1 Tax=Epilithonimonas hungarica TaxID=454006 RepID=A0A1G7MZD3_9FLAO|nr:EpsG family protein [Epilithonimonas hungarica]MPT31744.1 EpsG family protein [Chryseobacterium sp.]SDF67021.1 EpsG family protein [Epilithonimonas hungarica]
MQPTFSTTYSYPYIILFLIFFVFFLWENSIRKKDGDIKMVRYFCMLVFFVFFGFRGYLDTDWALYYPLYEKTPTLDDANGIAKYFSSINEDFILKVEPGFKVIFILLKSINEDYFTLQIFSSFVNVLFLNYFFKKYSPQYVLGFIMYLIFSGLIIEINLIRNSKAIFLFIYSIQFIKERKALQFFICNGMALFLHSSAIFFFPLYFFLHKKIPTPLVWGTFLLGNFLFLGQIKYISPIVIAIGDFFGGAYSLLAESYSNNKLYNSSYSISVGYLEKVFTFIILYYSYNKIGSYIKDNKTLNIFYNLFFLYITTYLFLSEYSVFIDRITTLFVCSYWILYPYLYATLKQGLKNVFTAVLLFFGIYKMVYSNNNILRNYENILWDKPTITKAYSIFNKHLDRVLNPKKK